MVGITENKCWSLCGTVLSYYMINICNILESNISATAILLISVSIVPLKLADNFVCRWLSLNLTSSHVKIKHVMQNIYYEKWMERSIVLLKCGSKV